MSYPLALATCPPLAIVLSAGSVRLTSTVKLDCVLGTLVWSTVRDRLQDAVDGVGVGVGVGAFTVTTKLVLVLLGPSFTVTVMVVLPVCPAAGVTVTVRLAPLPPNTIFPLGTSPRLDDAPLNCRFAGATCASPTVNGIGPVELFW